MKASGCCRGWLSVLGSLFLVLALMGCEAAPGEEGCAAEENVCGEALNEVCVDLNSDADHCGTCDAACPLPNLCIEGTCQLDCAALHGDAGLVDCDGECTDIQTSAGHCGACGVVCAAGFQCDAGACALACQEGLTPCADVCTDIATDEANCGACGVVCAAGEACVEGACALACPADLTQCEGFCLDLQRDDANCGECGVACPADQTCTDGACACADGLTACEDVCLDLNTDAANCGACATVCAAGEACVEGACVDACPEGLNNCGGTCKDLQADAGNCGGCGSACAAGFACVEGICALGCQDGLTDCDGTCRDLNTDAGNCGTCGSACAAGFSCVEGACALGCQDGLTDCDGTCSDLQADGAHCGTCGVACSAGSACVAGVCVLSCQDGLTDCDGTCRDLNTDPANCGTCATVCAAGELCDGAGVCALSCQESLTDCDGFCRDLTTDDANCGGCGDVCAVGFACVEGACALSCQDGLTDCDGTCRDLDTDPAHCGSCGATCEPGFLCLSGGCVLSCVTGLADCDGSCVDLETDLTHCGACGEVCASNEACEAGACVFCDSETTDCDGDGWTGGEGDCCDQTGGCGLQPALINPGAIEVVGNGIDDNCNGEVDLFDLEDTASCDAGLASDSIDPLDFAKALGICKQTEEDPAEPSQRTWGLLDAKLLRADGSPVEDHGSHSIRTSFGTVVPQVIEGSSVVVLSNGVAADTTQTTPGPVTGTGGFSDGTNHDPPSAVSIADCAEPHCISDWFNADNAPLKTAGALPAAPDCGNGTAGNPDTANDSVMLVLRFRAPTNARAFSFSTYFFSAEFPEYVCSNFNDQFIALVDTPSGDPQPIPNPADKNLLTYYDGEARWPIGINVAAGTSLFGICDSSEVAPDCWNANVSDTSCAYGSSQLEGSGFGVPDGETCPAGGGTFWLTSTGNVVPGQIVEVRIALWDVGDSYFTSLALIDAFQWLSEATLPGTL